MLFRSSEEIHSKINSYLKNDARNAIVVDIVNLSGIITSIEDDFATVTSPLTALDEKNIVSDEFAPAWKKLHKVRCFLHTSRCIVVFDTFHSGLYDAHARISTYCE